MTETGDKTTAGMPTSQGAKVVKFTDVVSTAPATLMLDANAVIDLFEHEVANSGRADPPITSRKHSELAGCLNRLVSKKTKLFVTPAVLEEVFHVISNKIVAQLKEKLRCSSCSDPKKREKDFREHHPAEFAKARAATVRLFNRALAAAQKHGVRVWLPDGTAVPPDGANVVKAFAALLDRFDALQGKDALHIATAAMAACNSIATRDAGFRQVDSLTVFCR